MVVGGLVAEGLVGTLGIAGGLKDEEGALECRQVQVAVIALPELPPHRAVEPFDAAVEFGGPRWQHGEGNSSLLTGRFKLGHELRSAVDLDGLDQAGEAGLQLREEGGGRARRGPRPHAKHGHPGNHVNGGELAALHPRQRAQVHRVELDQLARLGRLPLVLGDPRGMGRAGRRWQP